MKQVISTLDADNAYQIFGDLPRRVLVRGVAGLRHFGRGPSPSMATEISDADAEFLSNHGQFIEHQARGFVKIEDIESDSDYGRIA